METIVKDGATPSKLMLTAVIAGVTITKYLAAILSASMPMKGLSNQGKRWNKSHNEATPREIPNFSINNGRSGAKKEE